MKMHRDLSETAKKTKQNKTKQNKITSELDGTELILSWGCQYLIYARRDLDIS